MRHATIAVLLILLSCSGLSCKGACYTTSVYSDGHARHFCSNDRLEMDCRNRNGDIGFLGEMTSFDDWREDEGCEEGSGYTTLNPEDC